MTITEIYDLAKDVLAIDNLKLQQAAIPKDGTYEDARYEGMDVLEIDFDANIEYLHQLLY